MNKEELKEKLEEKNRKVVILGIVVGIVTLFFLTSIGFSISELSDNNENVCYDFKSFNETLEQIKDNCDSTFITKEYGEDSWSIFKTKNGKPKYTPLKKCMEEKNE